jgi:hypothetical protein
MSSLSPKDRVSLCMFSFADGRRCRTPRLRNHPHFCYYHAEKEARARAAQSLSTDLARYFSGTYLSACDLSTALGCLIPAVVRGDVKPKVARTVAYMAQTLLQSIHISQDEYINAFDTDGWRKSIRTSVHGNHIYRFPFTPSGAEGPAPQRSGGLQAGVPSQPQQPSEPQPRPTPAQQSAPPKPAQTPVNCHSERPDLVGERSEEPAFPHSSGPAPQPAPPPHTPPPPTSAEFVQHVLATLQTGEGQAPAPSPQPAEPSSGCHSERSEESVFSPSATQRQTQAQQPVSAPPANQPQPAPVAQPFTSAALPLPLRRRLNRTTTPAQASPLESTLTQPPRNC